MADTITFYPDIIRVEVVKSSGIRYTICAYSPTDHRRGGFVLGDVPCFRLSKNSTARVLKHFFPSESLTYLRKHGYIAN